jgi:putative MATE family efflux protein
VASNRSEASTGRDRLLHEPTGWAVFRLGLPLALGMASHALLNLVDLLMVGRLGGGAIAAAHVATTINFLPMILGNGISIATLSMLTRMLGQGRRGDARAFSNRSQIHMLMLGAIVSVVTAVLAPPCVDAIGLDGGIRGDAIHYLVVSNLGCLSMFALMQNTASMRAAGEIWMPLTLLVAANLVNLVLDVILLFGWAAMRIPSFGVVGAAYATVIARTMAAAAGYLWLMRPGHTLRFRWTKLHGRGQRVLWPLLGMAMPQLVQMLLRVLLVLLLTRVVRDVVGNDAVTAIGVTTRLDTLVLFGALGFASAATTLSGRSVVRGDALRARITGFWAGGQALVLGAIVIALLYTFAAPIVRLFLPDASQAVIDNAKLYLAVGALAHPLGAFAIGAIGAVHGAGRMVAPMLVDGIGFTILYGLVLLGTYVEHGALHRVYWLLVAGSLGLFVLHALYLGLGNWPRIDSKEACRYGSPRNAEPCQDDRPGPASAAS